MIELEAILRTCSDVNARLLRAELFALMRQAVAGSLSFGRDGQVDLMVSASTVLELRLKTTIDAATGDQLIRLYFTEPDHVPRCMLALKLVGKHPGPIGLQEQNVHAREAAYRADQHFLP